MPARSPKPNPTPGIAILISAWGIVVVLATAWITAVAIYGLAGPVGETLRAFLTTSIVAASVASAWWSIRRRADRLVEAYRETQPDYDTGYEHGHGDGVLSAMDRMGYSRPAREGLAEVHHIHRR